MPQITIGHFNQQFRKKVKLRIVRNFKVDFIKLNKNKKIAFYTEKIQQIGCQVGSSKLDDSSKEIRLITIYVVKYYFKYYVVFTYIEQYHLQNRIIELIKKKINVQIRHWYLMRTR